MGLIMKGMVADRYCQYSMTSLFHSGHSYKFFESSGPLRGFKRSLHEGGVRSPLIIRWVS